MKKKILRCTYRIHAGAVGLMYPGFEGFYQLGEDLITEPIEFTEKQHTTNIYEVMVEAHIRKTIREHVAPEVEAGNFIMYTVPWYSVEKREEIYQ